MSIPSNTMFLGVDPSKVNLTEKKSRILNEKTQYYSIEDFGGGLEGTDYVFVSANGTDVENAAELQAAYTTAQGMSPSSSKRITVVMSPGRYNFGSGFMTVGTSFIDMVSLTGETDVVFITTSATIGILVTATNATIKGINVLTKRFDIASDLSELRVEKCTGGDRSFGIDVSVTGTFIDCTAGNESFGFNGVVSGTFINCKASDGSFGFGSTVSGVFTDCIGGNECFGSSLFPGSSTANGVYIRCKSKGKSFGWNAYAGGTFIDCEADASGESFGGASSLISGQDWGALGTFTRCKSGPKSFGYVSEASGTFTDCVAGNESFGSFSNVNGSSNASGTFVRCTAGNSSFGNLCPASGTFTDCISGSASFGSGLGSIASGTFSGCVGGFNSFGKNGSSLTGKLYYCRLTSGTFATVSGGGITRLCIDGNNAENNQ
jgi:hypothetical protein